MSIQQILLGSSGPPLEASASPQNPLWFPPPSGYPGEAGTQTVTITASGGTGNYTYLWERVGGSSSINMNNPADSSAMAWSFFMLNQNSTAIGQFRCTVSDGVDEVVLAVTVTFGGA